MELSLTVTEKQMEFLEAGEQAVLFGGAAGGGKSYGQIVDALLFALRFRGSKQLILRRSFAELEKSLIRTSLALYPRTVYSFHATSHTGRFKNGSCIDFGYCASENDVYQYQSAEYDVVRFDELTHFTEAQYLYLISRVRGANRFPKQIKSSTNPGGVGHNWVKARFIDPSPPGQPFTGKDGMRRVFLPSFLADNRFLIEEDPDYGKRLLALPERERKALLDGDWNIFEGQYFSEFDRKIHICEPFSLPAEWRRYRTIDYGLDRLACLWIAVAPDRRAYVYREFCASDLPISAAAEGILSRTPKGESIYATLAPPDLWSRSQESGKSKAGLFSEYGLDLIRTSNDRETGWLAVKELLRRRAEGPGILFFPTCTEILKCLPALQIDKLRPTDCANEPHELTHAPDALRGFAIFHARPAAAKEQPAKRARWSADLWEDYEAADDAGKLYLKRKYGEPS